VAAAGVGGKRDERDGVARRRRHHLRLLLQQLGNKPSWRNLSWQDKNPSQSKTWDVKNYFKNIC